MSTFCVKRSQRNTFSTGTLVGWLVVVVLSWLDRCRTNEITAAEQAVVYIGVYTLERLIPSIIQGGEGTHLGQIYDDLSIYRSSTYHLVPHLPLREVVQDLHNSTDAAQETCAGSDSLYTGAIRKHELDHTDRGIYLP